MRVRVKLLASLRRYVPQGEEANEWVTVELEEGAQLKDLFKLLGIPEDLPKLALIDHKYVHLDRPLSDMEEVIVFPPIPGG